MTEKKIFLKKGREVAIEQGHHPWIFSGALDEVPEEFSSGDIASVYSFEGRFLGIGYFHVENSLSGRILSFEKKEIGLVLEEKIRKAYAFRQSLFDFSKTNAFRLINAEEDGLPGLIVDFYDGVLVLQIGTCGMEKLKELIVQTLITILSPKTIYEKSNSAARLQEGLDKREGLIYGDNVSEIEVLENGIRFAVSIVDGQKTGFFLDQREMRRKIGELSKGKTVLNCFSYSGGFSLYALKGGAKKVISVDTCSKAVELARKNTEINGFSLDDHQIVQQDVFAFLENQDLSDVDLIILDPPAFAKKRQDVESASKGYRQLAEMVFAKCKKGSFLLSCSCSYFIDADLFQKILFQAAAPHKKEVQILSGHIQAMDHPISLYHPEGDYLKSLLVWMP
jgi:23S rRNA (cytosine1962-C5)-methyltransferase